MRPLPKPLSFIALATLATLTAITPATAQTRGTRSDTLREPAPAQDKAPASDPVVIPRFPRQQKYQNTQPMFVVTAEGFTAVDETGFDWAGSDEVYSTWGSGTSYVGTQVFGDIDSGDSREYHELQSCIYPLAPHSLVNGRAGEGWQCVEGGGAGPISFWANLYEDDGISFPVCFSGGIAPAPDCEDDWIGSYSGSWTVEELVEMLPYPGSTQQFTRRLFTCENGHACGTGFFDADYDFHFSITRLADEEIPMTAFLAR